MAKELLQKVKQIHQRFPTGIVSAMRGEDSETVKRLGIEPDAVDEWNRKNTAELERQITAAGFQFIRLLGSYAEGGDQVQREVSFLVYSEKGKDPHDFVVSMGEKYDQDAVIVTPKAGEASFVYTNDTAGEGNPKGKVEPLGGLKIDSDSEWASTIEDEPESKFVYEKGGNDQRISETVSIYANAIKLLRL